MERYPLRRPESGRLILGVCQGIADHLGVNVWLVRIVFVVLGFFQFAGAFIYLWLVFAIASSTEIPDRAEKRFSPSRQVRLLFLALVTAIAAIVIWATQSIIEINLGILLSILCVGVGAALAWSRIGGSSIRVQAIRIISGIALLVIGVLIFAVRNEDPRTMLTSVVVGLAVLLLALVGMWPAAARIIKELNVARQESAAEAARADIAAHLHDSVLQTLTLIRNSASDPATVTRLARVQERQLRTWLYGQKNEEESLSESLRVMVGEVEDLYGVEIDFVSVGEDTAGEHTAAFLAAGREAVVNAVRHGEPPVSVYAEFSKDALELFVRDHGTGFELGEIPDDRHGVKDSILARTVRHGGTATIKTRDPGTEVHILIPRGES
ncbi:PspC domain-containing protein [Flaviflexus sp.]|uniref:PspC domain-containing protein n=1 Tax=Flaviflexus sp. TaxID=1969482 RepID=UPI003F92DD1C